MLNVLAKNIPLYMMILLFGLLSIISGLFLNEWHGEGK